MRSGVSTCANPLGGGHQDAPEGGRGTARAWFLQSALPHGESDGGMETCHRPFDTEQLCHSDEVKAGDRRFSPGVSLPRELDVLCRPPGRVFSDPSPSGVSPICAILRTTDNHLSQKSAGYASDGGCRRRGEPLESLSKCSLFLTCLLMHLRLVGDASTGFDCCKDVELSGEGT